MEYYVNNQTELKTGGAGTKEKPFATIGEAAKTAKAGDRVIVAPGIYREYVDPVYGGEGEESRIVYCAAEKGTAVITGAEEVKRWTHYDGDVWSARIPNSLFKDYNPYTTEIFGDWYYTDTPLHTGEVYLNGKAMYETLSLEETLNPKIYAASWDPDFTLYKWFTCQDGDDTLIYANFRGKDPTKECVEINVRRNCFYPSKTGVNYITLSGFVVKQAATQWAPPTAYQEGMVGPHWAKGWIIEDCEISDSRCSGISLGKYLQPENDNKWMRFKLKDGTQTEREAICQAQAEGWTKERIGSHIVRRCNIHDCGQTGIVGHLGGVFSIIENNHIHHINNKQDLSGAEIGGIKMHAAIDVVIRGNHFHHCTRGLWLDWQAQGTRVTGNVFHDNTPPKGCEITNALSLGEDIFVEVSHGPTLIDNNLLLSSCAGRLSTQGLAFVHNIICGSFTYVGKGTDNSTDKLPSPRYTPYHMKHRTEVAGFMTILHGDARFYNNIFIQGPIREDLKAYAKKSNLDRSDMMQFVCGTVPYENYPLAGEYFDGLKNGDVRHDRDRFYRHLPVYYGGNVYFNGAKPCTKESNAYRDTENTVTWSLRTDGDNVVFKTNLYGFMPRQELEMITTDTLGEAFEPEQAFEDMNGEKIIFDKDINGNLRKTGCISGPFAEGGSEFLLEVGNK